jgi:hypothetical protein
MRGYHNGTLMWTYPSRWPGLHASHQAPQRGQFPGELIGTTRLLGHPIHPAGSTVGDMWAINGNAGVIYLMTADGLFVATVGQDRFRGQPWPSSGEREIDLSNVWFHDEHFWPTINQSSDGKIYLLIGKNHNSIVRIDGLETTRHLPAFNLEVSKELLTAAETYRIEAELKRQEQRGPQQLLITKPTVAPKLDGDLQEWSATQFVPSYKDRYDNKPVVIEGALAIQGEHLFAAFRCFDTNLLANSGDNPAMLFKTGGALDLMLATNGNQRLLVTRLNNKTTAVLYRQTVAGTPADKRIPFSSPTRSVWFDRVDDVSESVQLAGDKGVYEFSIPLATLGLDPTIKKLTGDIGVLRGAQGVTTQRLYWHNKATSITADVPSEAMLTPQLWGNLIMAP